VTTKFVDNKNEIAVDLIKKEGIEKDLLYDFIQSRQCTRTGYDDKPIDESLLEELSECAKDDVVEIIYITDKYRIKELEPFIIEASNLQFNNQQFVNELVNWFRFSRKKAEEKRDGLWTASMGLPNMPKPIGNFIMKNFVSAKSEAKRWKNLINQSAGFALFVVKENSKENWVKLGQSFERFCLKATQLNIKHAHVNMPCEEISVRQKLIKHFNLGNGQQPLLLIRFGYAEAMPYSYRLLLDEVLLEE
jgi:hypothetical protein